MLKRVLFFIFVMFGFLSVSQTVEAYDLPAQTGEIISVDYVDTPENSSVSTLVGKRFY